MNHYECIVSELQIRENVINTFNSKFSYFFETEEFIFKARKKDSKLFFEESNLQREVVLTKREFARGSLFEHSLYKNIIDIPCLHDNVICNVALKMIRIPLRKRIDSQLNVITKNTLIVETIAKKIKLLFDEAPEPSQSFDYYLGLANGNERMINSLLKHNDKEGFGIFYNAWDLIKKKTQENKDVFKSRQKIGRVKELHGDLSFQNTFYSDGFYIVIDPCVAYSDMYTIDLLYQFADVIVEFLRFKLYDFANKLIDCYNVIIEEKICKELLCYYIYRHSLIRATVHWMFNDKMYTDYLTVKDMYDLQS